MCFGFFGVCKLHVVGGVYDLNYLERHCMLEVHMKTTDTVSTLHRDMRIICAQPGHLQITQIVLFAYYLLANVFIVELTSAVRLAA